jgi:tetratricopeptide (TPR) repeat protein
MKTAECTKCGANVSFYDQTCSYYGVVNPEYLPPADEANALLEKAMDVFQQEHYAAAIDLYNQVIVLDPDIFSAYFPLAFCLISLGRNRDAIQVMHRALALRPGNTAVHVNLGIMYKKEGKKGEARNYLEKALRLVDSDGSVDNRADLKQYIKKELSGLKRWGLF